MAMVGPTTGAGGNVSESGSETSRDVDEAASSADEGDSDNDEPPPKRQKQAEVDAVWKDQSAGLRLISADDVTFYVPAYHLQSASEVLRVMIATNTKPSAEPKEIAFADGEIELASALRIFLLVLTTNDLLQHLETHPREFVLGFRGALGFAGRYVCTSVEVTLHRFFHDLATDKKPHVGPHDLFAIGAILDEPNWCAEVIAAYDEIKKYSRVKVTSPWGVMLPGKGFDADRLNIRLWNVVKNEYILALCSANQVQGQAERGQRFLATMEKLGYDGLQS